MSEDPDRGARRLKLALAASLALNLGVAGIVGGSYLGRLGHPPPPPPVRDLGFGPFAQALTPEDRAALFQAFADGAPDMRAMRRDMRQEFGSLLAALRSDPFDEAELRAALAAQDARARARLDLGQRLLADRLVEMTPEQRRAFADRLEDGFSRGPGRKPGGDAEGAGRGG